MGIINISQTLSIFLSNISNIFLALLSLFFKQLRCKLVILFTSSCRQSFLFSTNLSFLFQKQIILLDIFYVLDCRAFLPNLSFISYYKMNESLKKDLVYSHELGALTLSWLQPELLTALLPD